MVAGILVSGDLMFISKVREVAVAAGGEVRVARSLEALEKAIGDAAVPGALMIDLEKCGISVESLQKVVSPLLTHGWKVVSFFSHVHEELGARAQSLGLGEVMPRSKFVRVLPGLFEG